MIYNEDYQYDSCVSRGICSVNPRTSSLQEILVLYLRLSSYYALKLYENAIRPEVDELKSEILSNVQGKVDEIENNISVWKDGNLSLLLEQLKEAADYKGL